ncbi:MAG: hypothetical protein MJZ05_01915 [Fibrobacter sp.]|nr:hypothetical protein [Fibrobacter sp.]
MAFLLKKRHFYDILVKEVFMKKLSSNSTASNDSDNSVKCLEHLNKFLEAADDILSINKRISPHFFDELNDSLLKICNPHPFSAPIKNLKSASENLAQYNKHIEELLYICNEQFVKITDRLKKEEKDNNACSPKKIASAKNLEKARAAKLKMAKQE